MKSKLCLLVCLAIPLAPSLSQAQSTAFTYQGRLNDGSHSATGRYDLRFAIWDAASDGTQIGNTITNTAFSVSNGLFTVTLDFDSVFDGSSRWIEIGVRTNGAGSFSTLSPRQPLTAVPYAIYAGGVNAAAISGTITSGMLATGAASANLSASGQSAVPSGGVIFSGSDNDTNLLAAGYVKAGGYVTAPNLWRQQTASLTLASRQGHAAVWNGSKMLVWGGYCGNDNPNTPPPKIRFSDGGSYDPVANTWSAWATNGAPVGREEFVSVWTGTELIVWGGFAFDGSYHYFNDGARYNLTSNTWTPLTTNGAPAGRYYFTAVCSGTEIIVWGGLASDGSGSQLNSFGDGYRYNLLSNTWSAISTNGAPTPRCQHTAVWTGTEMIIWGGLTGSGLTLSLNDGARYNASTDTWSPLNLTNAPSARRRHTAVWTGSEMIVWGGFNAGPYEPTGGRYDPAKDSWSETDYLFAPTGRIRHTAIWTGREMIIWGGECANPAPQCNDGGSYDPTSNTWTPVTTSPRAPTWRMNHSAVWTGKEMIVCYGGDGTGVCRNDVWLCTPPRPLYLYMRP